MANMAYGEDYYIVGNKAYIPLSKSKKVPRGFAVIDSEDVDKVMAFNTRWHLCNKYAATNKNKRMIYLHRVVSNVFDVKYDHKRNEVDHINMVKLDNRKVNLRVGSSSENHRNLPLRKTSRSGHKGICWHKINKKWFVRIDNNTRIGMYDSLDDAIEARKEAEKKYWHKEQQCR